MVTVTYRQLIPMDTDYPGISSQIEGFTGARQIYGLDTPINILDIIDNVSLTVGLWALSYADAQVVCENIAIACLRGNMDPWFAGDVRVTNLLTDIETYLATKDTPGTPKLDSCGDPVPGFYGVIPLSQLVDNLAAIKVSSDALDLNAGTIYKHSYWLTQGMPYSPAQIAYWQAQAIIDGRYTVDLVGVNTTDPVNNAAQPIPGYVPTNIAAPLLLNPNTFSNDSATFDVQNPSGSDYGLLIHETINSKNFDISGIPVSYINTAIQMLVDQLSQLVLMITENVNLLPGIVSATQNYMMQYATEQRLKIGPEIARLNDIGLTGIFPVATNDPNMVADEQAINNAGLNERAALLHNQTYITSFSNNGTTLTGAERATLENAVRAQMKAVRISTAAALYASRQAQYDALAQLYSNARIVSLITPYLL